MKRIFITLIGGTLLLIGLAMIVLPGPAIVVVPAALGILGMEFAWARSSLKWLRKRFNIRSSEKRPTTESSFKTPHTPLAAPPSPSH